MLPDMLLFRVKIGEIFLIDESSERATDIRLGYSR